MGEGRLGGLGRFICGEGICTVSSDVKVAILITTLFRDGLWHLALYFQQMQPHRKPHKQKIPELGAHRRPIVLNTTNCIDSDDFLDESVSTLDPASSKGMYLIDKRGLDLDPNVLCDYKQASCH